MYATQRTCTLQAEEADLRSHAETLKLTIDKSGMCGNISLPHMPLYTIH